MHEIRKDYRLINDEEIETWTGEFCSANTVEVEVGTNGYKGGDTGHGSRTYFRFKDLACTDVSIKCTEDEVEIELGGDTELETFIQSLEFALKVLKEQSKE